MNSRSFASVALSATLLLSAPVIAKAKLDSHWPTEAIEIDGAAEDWGDFLVPIDAEQLSLGVANDDTSLYVSFVTSDLNVAFPALTQGLVLSLKPKGGDRLEIRFPVGAAGSADETSEDSGADAFRRRVEQSVGSGIDVRQGGKEYTRLAPENEDGVRARVTVSEGRMFYELQVPLGGGDASAFALAAAPGDALAVRIQHEKPASSGGQRRRPSAAGMDFEPGGAAPSRPGGTMASDLPPAMRGAVSQGGGGGAAGSPGGQAFKLDATVRLAKAPSD